MKSFVPNWKNPTPPLSPIPSEDEFILAYEPFVLPKTDPENAQANPPGTSTPNVENGIDDLNPLLGQPNEQNNANNPGTSGSNPTSLPAPERLPETEENSQEEEQGSQNNEDLIG
ncbi:hypothetical protein CpB0275 [Chlamydia pneumoniae TW-183]|nr:hypothetical protein [Chlamydia pneumoniae]AAP98208.1 hypothetical protein CpB0275 [Chlamydia pneumoniae TW-183]CRI35630.1 Uncharacterized protein BN1224_CM1_A_02770 [Chlamydia pneumoniae]CRI36757.1 Uncharacterized protein BN1224_CV14_A_02760 [Chlamydia pneumoniae]CRI37880.1 Uncharacterized protein BN1224_CV15_B_02030 [Chlamydia pneumoniae]CRI39015.1 Uncharacterized protein BN1224_CWL011_A_02790 [Chlamydia pneumoniae]